MEIEILDSTRRRRNRKGQSLDSPTKTPKSDSEASSGDDQTHTSSSRRRHTDGIFLVSFVIIHRDKQENEYKMWTLKKLFNFVDEIITGIEAKAEIEKSFANAKLVKPALRRPTLNTATSFKELPPPAMSRRKSVSSIGMLKAPSSHALTGSSPLSIGSNPNSELAANTKANAAHSHVVPTANAFGTVSHGVRRASFAGKFSPKTGLFFAPEHSQSPSPVPSVVSSNHSAGDIITAPVCTHRLVFRDLKRLDFQFADSEHLPTILIRRHCIVLSFYPVRAIILAGMVILLSPQKASVGEESMRSLKRASISDVTSVTDGYVQSFEQYMKGRNPNFLF